jgi:lipopolysaccharide export system permease protein
MTTYLFVVIMLVLIICVIDFTEKNDDFIKHKLSAFFIIKEYYILLFPYWANTLSPITVFISAVFVTSQMASHTEIIAILSSGVSFKRLLFPYFLGASVIAAIIFVLIGWIIPEANKKRVAFEMRFVGGTFAERFESHIHMKIASNTYIFMERYNLNANIGYKFAIEYFDSTGLVKKINADRILWNAEKEIWKFDRYTERTFDGQNETLVNGSDLEINMPISPKDFKSNYREAETLTFPELNAFIKSQSERGADDLALYYVEKYERYLYPYAIVILTLMGVIMSARKVRGGIGLQIAIGFVLAFIYIIFVMMSRSLSQSGSNDSANGSYVP